MKRWLNFQVASDVFPFTSLLHIDAQQIAGADATPITSTPNLGTAGGNITSPNGANTPQIHTGGQNSLRYLAYTGGSGSYHDSDATLLSGLGSTGAVTMFCVASLVKPASGNPFIFDGGLGSGGTDPRYLCFDNLGIDFGRAGFIRIVNASYSAGAVKCLSGVINGASSAFRTNGISDVTGTISATANTWAAFTIGAQSGVHSQLLTFDLYELILVTGALSSGDITTAETFLVNKYALT